MRMQLEKNSNFFLLLIALAIFIHPSCEDEGKQREKLPILGEMNVENGDTTYHSIPPFEFVDQDSQLVDNTTLAGHIYVADFFFTSCPTICPKVKKQMLRLYERFEDEPRLKFLSHTVDPKRDSVETLHRYAENLGVSSDRWHFVTGEQDELYEIADDYFSIAREDPSAPGGYDHSGRLILVDTDGHVRSYCNGTDSEDVDRFMNDIELLLHEMGT